MPRVQTVIRMTPRCWDLDINEWFELRMDLPNGDVLRTDNEGLWFRNDCSWFGSPPELWDESKAVAEPFHRNFQSQVDYG